MVMKDRQCPVGSTTAKCYNIVNSEGFERCLIRHNTIRKIQHT